MATGVVLGDARVLAPRRLRWLRALAWIAVLAVAAVATFNVSADATLRFAAWIDGSSFTTRAAAPDGARLAAVCVGSVAMLAVYWMAVRFGEYRTVSELRLRPLVPETLGGLAIGSLLIAAIIGILVAFGWATVEPSPIARILPSLKETVQAAVIEETLFRIILFRLLWRAFGVWPAVIGAALVFGGLHLLNPDSTLFSAACLLAGEGIADALYMLRGRLWLPIGMHAGWDFTQGWIFGSAVSGTTFFAGGPLVTHPVTATAAMLNGGGFGPESTVASLVVSLIASAALLYMAWSNGGLREQAAITSSSTHARN